MQDVLFVSNHPEGGAEHRLQARVQVMGGFDPLAAPGELLFLHVVGGPGADHGDDGDEPVNVPDIAHPGEADHGRALDVVDASGFPVGDHLPDARVFPRLELLQVGADSARGQRCEGVADDGEAALGEDVHLHQADGLHGVHVEMGGGIAFVGEKDGGELLDWVSGKYEAAGMHLRVTRESFHELGQLDGGLEWLFIPRDLFGLGT